MIETKRIWRPVGRVTTPSRDGFYWVYCRETDQEGYRAGRWDRTVLKFYGPVYEERCAGAIVDVDPALN
jgi:hypothetical protein